MVALTRGLFWGTWFPGFLLASLHACLGWATQCCHLLLVCISNQRLSLPWQSVPATCRGLAGQKNGGEAANQTVHIAPIFQERKKHFWLNHKTHPGSISLMFLLCKTTHTRAVGIYPFAQPGWCQPRLWIQFSLSSLQGADQSTSILGLKNTALFAVKTCFFLWLMSMEWLLPANWQAWANIILGRGEQEGEKAKEMHFWSAKHLALYLLAVAIPN